MWHKTGDKWQMSTDIWQVGGGEPDLKISACSSYGWELEVTCDTWHVKSDTWYLTCDTWHMTPDIWHTWGDEYCVNISGPKLLGFGCEGVLKILKEMITDSWINWLINDQVVCRTAPATPGLIITMQECKNQNSFLVRWIFSHFWLTIWTKFLFCI